MYKLHKKCILDHGKVWEKLSNQGIGEVGGKGWLQSRGQRPSTFVQLTPILLEYPSQKASECASEHLKSQFFSRKLARPRPSQKIRTTTELRRVS